MVPSRRAAPLRPSDLDFIGSTGGMKVKKTTLILFAVLLLLATPAVWAGKVSKMDTPLLNCGGATPVSIDMLVCAGITTGAPAGFSLQWITAAQLAAGPDGIAGTADDNTWPSSDS